MPTARAISLLPVRHSHRALLAVAILLFMLAGTAEARVVVVVIEGLRPEHITKRAMQSVAGISREGFASTAYRAVFPVIPESNAASILTGRHPSGHGIVDSPEHLAQAGLEPVVSGPTIVGVLREHGLRSTIMASGLEDFWTTAAAEIPVESFPSDDDLVNAYIERKMEPAAFTLLWLGDLNRNGNIDELSPRKLNAALRDVNARIERIIEHHQMADAAVDLLLISDRPAPRHVDRIDLEAELIRQGYKESHTSTDVLVIGGNTIRVAGRDREKTRAIVQWLQRQAWAGVVYTHQARPTHPEGFVPGALSFHAVYMNHANVPDILVNGAPTGGDGHYAFAGDDGGQATPAGLDSVFVASGPHIKSGITSEVPATHTDLLPTIAHLLGIASASEHDGRVLHEILANGPDPTDVPVLRRRQGARTEWEGGYYQTLMHEATVDDVDYLEQVTLRRAGN